MCCSTHSNGRLSPGPVRSLSRLCRANPHLSARYRGRPARPPHIEIVLDATRMSLEPGCVAANNPATGWLGLAPAFEPLFFFFFFCFGSSELSRSTRRHNPAIYHNCSAHLSLANRTYQKWPTWKLTLVARTSLKQVGLLTYLKFENRLRAFRPQGL